MLTYVVSDMTDSDVCMFDLYELQNCWINLNEFSFIILDNLRQVRLLQNPRCHSSLTHVVVINYAQHGLTTSKMC